MDDTNVSGHLVPKQDLRRVQYAWADWRAPLKMDKARLKNGDFAFSVDLE
jgi:hypothetical protein